MATRIHLFFAILHSHWPYSRSIFVCVTVLYRRTNLVRTPTKIKAVIYPAFLSKNYSSLAQQNSVSFFSLSSFVRQLQKKTADVLFFRAKCVINVSILIFFSFSFVFVFPFTWKENSCQTSQPCLQGPAGTLAHQDLRVHLERREYQDPVVLWDHQDVPVATERMENEESKRCPGDGSNAPGHLTNQKIVDGTMDKCM